jgi:hypothetical protein
LYAHMNNKTIKKELGTNMTQVLLQISFLWLKYIMYMYENRIMKSTKNCKIKGGSREVE